ncbi:sulfatase [Sphingobacterium paludis]|uniref:Iduronate 2-sulfatase n=1 Tax=Sphingobacterium paludis TaxID=1476465 RepID=A0A4R7CU50_9SPHI|nr:sulfatase [Sphingobacterium paludis]TDS10950.1 iduronate 2-sulfatase [Sphingobacterium paludis]
MNKTKLYQITLIILCNTIFIIPPSSAQMKQEKPNVLFILIDDLKPAIHGFGDVTAITPNIDALINRGVRFDRAYSNQAVCVASRNSLLLGSRPTSTGLYDFGRDIRQYYPDAVTLPEAFKNQGYFTQAIGKVFHIGHNTYNDPQSWSAPHFHEKIIEYLTMDKSQSELTIEEALFENHSWEYALKQIKGIPWESPDVPDEAYGDGRVANKAVQVLDSLQAQNQPFFLAVGFARPHLPFSVPKKYWHYYDEAKLPLPLTEQYPEGAPKFAVKRTGEIEQYQNIPDYKEGERYPDSLKRRLIHGYYAGVSYVDAQIGKVIAELRRSGLDKNTIVVLWGDHGYLLGDMGMWTKHVNYELANRVPLIISVPNGALSGYATASIVETVDIYPTLIELAGLTLPKENPLLFDGESLVPLLTHKKHKIDYAYHCYPRDGWMGRSIRTDQYRLVEWTNIQNRNLPAQYEFYIYDKDLLEHKNEVDFKNPAFLETLALLRQQPDYHAPLPASPQKKIIME